MKTQSEAMQQFLETMKSTIDNWKSPYKSIDEMLEDWFSFVEPFLANPERHKDALKAIMEGISQQCLQIKQQEQESPGDKIIKMIIRPLRGPYVSLFYVRRIKSIRDPFVPESSTWTSFRRGRRRRKRCPGGNL
jgi:hypothetical protein